MMDPATSYSFWKYSREQVKLYFLYLAIFLCLPSLISPSENRGKALIKIFPYLLPPFLFWYTWRIVK